MKKIIIGLMFVFATGICYGQYTVVVEAVRGGSDRSKFKPLIARETLTRLLETSAANLGYTVIDRAVIDETRERLGPYQAYKLLDELNPDFVISGSIGYDTLSLTIKDMKTGEQHPDTFRITRSEKSAQRKFEKSIRYLIGSADAQQVFQQEAARREEGPLREDAWRNKKVYMGVGGGVGFGTAIFQVGDEIQSGFGANVTGSLRTDFGKSSPAVSNKGYAIDYGAFGTGVAVSVSDGYVSFLIPLEGRFARRYNRTELGFGGGLGIGFGPGSFMLPVIIDGSIGWKAGPGIIFFEGQLGYDLIAAARKTMGFSGSVLLGYKFGLGK